MVVSSWKRFTRTGVVSKEMPLSMVCIWVQTLDPYLHLVRKFLRFRIRRSGNLPNLFSPAILYPKDPPCFSSSPAANRATVGREEGLQGQSPPQRPICSSRRSYIPAAVLEVCKFSAGHQQFWAFRAGELTEERRRREKKRHAGRGVPLSTVSI